MIVIDSTHEVMKKNIHDLTFNTDERFFSFHGKEPETISDGKAKSLFLPLVLLIIPLAGDALNGVFTRGDVPFETLESPFVGE